MSERATPATLLLAKSSAKIIGKLSEIARVPAPGYLRGRPALEMLPLLEQSLREFYLF